MNVLARPTRLAEAQATPNADFRCARVEIFDDLREAEPYWRMLEEGFATPYQRYDFLKAWQGHFGRPAGVTPCIVLGFAANGSPLFLWPFGRRRIAGCQVVEFLGGDHCNFNMALWRYDATGSIDVADLQAALAKLAGRADLLRLCNQPLTWGGSANPFALLEHQPAANCGFSGALIADFDALLRSHTNSATRKKMHRKERALAELGTVTCERVETPTRIRQVLDAFFTQKHARMRMLGIADVFGEPGVRRFIEAATIEGPPSGEPPIELYALSVGDVVVATMGGIVGGGRFCAMFNSIASGPYAVQSPGEQLLVCVIRRCCKRGLHTFDLGIGEAHYKGLFCDTTEPLFNSFLPLTTRGRLLAAAFRASAAGKRAIKQHALLWAQVQRLRRLRARFSAAP